MFIYLGEILHALNWLLCGQCVWASVMNCLIAGIFLPLKNFSTGSLLSQFYLISPMNTLIQNLGKFCGPDPLLMENWGHPWRTTDLCPLAIWLTQNEIKRVFLKDIAEKTGNDLLSLRTNSILLSSFSVKHPHKTWCPTRGWRKEALSQQSSRRPASAPSSPPCRFSVVNSTAEIRFQALFQWETFIWLLLFYPAAKFKN